MQTARRFFLTIVAIIKDERPYLAEWIEYHSLLGAEHFYIYDNGSSDRPDALLRDYIVQGRVTLLHWPEFPGQLSAYNHAIRIFGRDSAWMAIIDIDEFILPPRGRNIPTVLADVAAEADQMLLPWMHFGSSGHDAKPDGLVIENYVHRSAEAHHQTKPIVRPETVMFIGVHHCETRSGRTIDSAGDPASERWVQPRPIATEMRINHYFTKSRTEFAEKIARGQSDGGNGKSLADFDRFETPVRDDSLAAMAAPVRAAIAETEARPKRLLVHAPWSAQSELTPSDAWQKAVNRRWIALRDSLAAPNAPRLDIGPSRAALHGVRCAEPSFSETYGRLRSDLDLLLVSELTDWPVPCQRLLRGKSPLGRPCLLWRGESRQPATLIVNVIGSDAGGKSFREERRLAIDPGGTVACLILSERTMRIERIGFAEAEPGGIICTSAMILSFV